MKNNKAVFVIKSEIMDIIQRGELVILRFKALEKFRFLNQAVSTRLGGVSSAKGLESLNLGTHTADNPENVKENYRRFCDAAGFDVNSIVLGNQTHSTNVRYATEADMGKGVFCDRDYTDVDALVTDVRGLPLVIHTADCVPVGFAGKYGVAVGNAHCGWRGTYGRLAQKTLEEMQKRFGVTPSDVICTVGPCICMNCYEVSGDLFDKFRHRFGTSDALVHTDGRFYIDLAALNRDILISCGVPEQNIIVSDLCTCCNTDYLFSHRGQGPERGILASVIELV